MTLNLELPDPLKSHLEEQVARGGFRDASEYVQSLLEADRIRVVRDEVERALLEAVDGPFTPLTSKAFDDVRSEGRRLIRQRAEGRTQE